MKKILLSIAVLGLFYAGSAIAAVNINTADADQLEALSGIGSVKAQAIVDDRDVHGDYDRLDDLTRVDGIGDKTVANLQSEATVDDDMDDGDTSDSDDG